MKRSTGAKAVTDSLPKTAGRTDSTATPNSPAVAEGVNATESALTLAPRLNVEIPIAQTTYRIRRRGLPPGEAVAELMEHPVGSDGGVKHIR